MWPNWFVTAELPLGLWKTKISDKTRLWNTHAFSRFTAVFAFVRAQEWISLLFVRTLNQSAIIPLTRFWLLLKLTAKLHTKLHRIDFTGLWNRFLLLTFSRGCKLKFLERAATVHRRRTMLNILGKQRCSFTFNRARHHQGKKKKSCSWTTALY